MYPQQELIVLSRTKAGLRRRIAARRSECAAQAVCVTRPLRWLDRIRAHWQRFVPFAQLAAMPVGWWLVRRTSRRGGLLSQLLRWGPGVLGLVRGLTRRPADR